MSSSPTDDGFPPYALFLRLEPFQKGVGVASAVAAVIALGFVPASLQVGGDAGWPLHGVLHPLLGVLMGPVYGTLGAVLGTTASEVVTPYTALGGFGPLLGGAGALAAGLLVRSGRERTGAWGLFAVLVGGGLGVAYWTGSGVPGGLASVGLAAPALLLAAIPSVRGWCRRQLTPSRGTWGTALALYVVCFVGSTLGLLALWGAQAGTGPAVIPEDMAGATVRLLLERLLLPVGGTLLGMALWPALQRRLFSVANQLRYGLPLFILATFFFAGRLFMERAYQAARTETTQRLRNQSRVVARTLDTELDRAEKLLYARTRASVAQAPPQTFFRWIERVGAGGGQRSTVSPEVRALVERVRTRGRAQRGFVSLEGAPTQGIVLALPLGGERAARSPAAVDSVVVACIEPSVLRRTLSIWDPAQTHLYLVNRHREPVAERRRSPGQTARDPAPFVQSLLNAPNATAEAAHGRYETDVIGAIAPLEGLSGYVVVEQAQREAYVHMLEMLLTMALIVLLTGGGALAVGFYVSRRVVTPLDHLIDAARRVGEGDLSTRVPVEQDNELGELAHTFNTMTRDLSASIERVRANEEHLRIALDAAQMGTWEWSPESESGTWSPQTYALLGVPETRKDGLFEAYLARVYPEDRSRVRRTVRAVLEDKTDFTMEHRIRARHDEVRWVRVQGRVFRTDGRPDRLSGIIMDITARKEAEEELRAAKEKAEEMSQLKSAFLANVSHEIRTPLTSIIGFAEILVEEVPDSHEDAAKKIVRSGRRLMETLDSVLDLSMIEAGEFSLECRTFDLEREVRQRVDLIRPMARRKGLRLTVNGPSSETCVYLDPNGVDRILTNLLTNAIKFTEEGHVEVNVSAKDEHVVVEVSDSGIGIEDDFLPDLFDAFKQESGGLRREHGGTGLGLSITKQLVNLMGGEIAVESQKGVGTTVTVRLPYEAVDSEGTSAAGGKQVETA